MEDIGPQLSTGSTHLTLLAQEMQICLLSRAHADSHSEGSWENYNGLKAPQRCLQFLVIFTRGATFQPGMRVNFLYLVGMEKK